LAFRTFAREELCDLALTLLPADAATHQRFTLFGLTRMNQLADLPRSAVGGQFGPVGERLQALARGHDPRPIVPRRRPERAEVSVTFETPLDGIGAGSLTLRRMAAELCDRLRERHLAPGRAVLSITLEDAPALRVAQPFPQPALEPDWIARLLLSRVEAAARSRSCRGPELTAKLGSLSASAWSPVAPADNFRASRGPKLAVSSAGGQLPEEEPSEPRVAALTLAFDRLSNPATHQMPAFEARAGRWEELRWSLERIRHRFGEERLWRAVAERPTAALPEHRSRLVDIGP